MFVGESKGVNVYVCVYEITRQSQIKKPRQINNSIVVCPVIDVISWEKMEYSTIRGPPGVRGGFNWGLQFKWKKIPDYEQERRNHDETR